MDSLPLPSTERLRRPWWLPQFGVGIVIGALALGWAIQGLDWKSVLRALTSAQYAWVLISLFCVFAVALIKTVRWGALYLTSAPHPSFADLFSALMITQMVNVIIPVRIGELIRIGLMKQSGQPGAATLSTIAIEKAVDLVAAGLIAVSVVFLAVAPMWLQNWAGSVLVMGLVLVAGLILVWYQRDWIGSVLSRALAFGGWLPERWQSRLLRVAQTMLESFGALTDWHALGRVLFWTMLAWLFSLLAVWTLIMAFGLPLSLTAAAVVMLSLSFSNIIPSPPGLIGVIQAIAMVVLGGYGVPQPIALGFGIVLNVVTVAPLILLGSLALWQRAVSLLPLLREYPLRVLWRKP